MNARNETGDLLRLAEEYVSSIHCLTLSKIQRTPGRINEAGRARDMGYVINVMREVSPNSELPEVLPNERALRKVQALYEG